jgi:hypothetical protein
MITNYYFTYSELCIEFSFNGKRLFVGFYKNKVHFFLAQFNVPCYTRFRRNQK